MQRTLRGGGWTAVIALVVLVARTLAYALAPDPRAEALGQVTGGPRPVVVGAIALGLAGVLAGGVLWISALGVRERHRLRPLGAAPRMRLVPVLVRACAVALAASLVFATIETSIHVHDGLGFHGLHCLTGPVHENALPLIGALSLIASALVQAVRHAYAFGKRVVAARPPRCRVPPAARSRLVMPGARRATGFGPLAAPAGRGPPVPSFCLMSARHAAANHICDEGVPPTMSTLLRRRRLLAILAAAAGTLAISAPAYAHAIVSPSVVPAKESQQFTLSVPTEEEGQTTNKIVLTVPDGFAVDSFEAAPGWTRVVKATGSGEDAVVNTITWSGGKVPTDEDAVFRFNASVTSAGTVEFNVRQYYSDGTVVDWSGPEGSDTPAPVVHGVSDLGGSSTDTLTIVALVLAVAALLVAIGGIFVGRRPVA